MTKNTPTKDKSLSSPDQSAAIILAAGLGTRMKSGFPKVMHKVGGQPMICHVIETLKRVGIKKIIVVVSKDMESLENIVKPYPTVVQTKQLGTGHAVKAALKKLDGSEKNVLVMFGADPLILPQTIKKMIIRREQYDNPAAVALGFKTKNPKTYGRLITNSADKLDGIVEAKDASPEQLAIRLCNAGTMAIDGFLIKSLINSINNRNSKKEYYLTDLIKIAHKRGHTCAYVEGSEEELIGVDNRADLARAEALFQTRARKAAMKKGVTLIDPSSTYFSWDTRVGKDVIIEPNVFLAPGVTIRENVTIRSFCYLEDAFISEGCVIGPFARLRPGTKISKKAKIGNFVEVKNSAIGPNVNINHLSYIGDAFVGQGSNIGAGTITCNFDGISKHQTKIGKNTFIGSNSSLIAPLSVGDGATIGAGSAINKNVSDGALSLTRAPQKEIQDWDKQIKRNANRK